MTSVTKINDYVTQITVTKSAMLRDCYKNPWQIRTLEIDKFQ